MITLLAAAVLALSPQKLDISVDVKPGETISGLRHFKVSVGADDPVTQVEFYVGTELRDSDSSVPYEFDLDTIEEKDGDIELTFAAYTNRGDSAKKVIDLKVDNGLSEGVDAHVAKGVDFLHNSDWDHAIIEGRIALKIAPDDNRARMVMAQAYLGKGVLDKAQKYAEDWHTSAPNDVEAAELLSGIDVHRAFSTMSRGSDREAALKGIRDALQSAIQTRQQVMQSRLDKIGAPTSDNAVQYADAAIAAGRLTLAINALNDEYEKHVERTDITNRLAYAQLMAGRVPDAYKTLTQVERLAKLDAYGNALMAVIHSIGHEDSASGRYMAMAIQMDPTNLGVQTAQAFIALQSGKNDDLAKIVANLQQDSGALPEVNYYVYALADAQSNYEDGRKAFENTLDADPLSEEAYLEEGNNYLQFAVQTKKTAADDKSFRLEGAKAMYETALDVRPESYRGLVGLALTCLMGGENEDALKYADAAVKAAPTEPSALFVQSAALSLNAKHTEANNADRAAWRYDRTVLGGRGVPNAMEAWEYFSKSDKMPVITAPK